jgi:hypothetical protein
MTSARRTLVVCCLAVAALAVPQAASAQLEALVSERSKPMAKYVIERDLPGAGKLSARELQAISQKSRSVLRDMGTRIQWVQSYVTDDKIYCVYIAEDEADIRKHAAAGGFPVNRVSRIQTMIDPTTAD